eukprot:1063210-Pleurochrysis_carterae.AAC.1
MASNFPCLHGPRTLEVIREEVDDDGYVVQYMQSPMPLPDKDYSGESSHARQRKLEMCNGLVCGTKALKKEEVPGAAAMPQLVHGDAEVSKGRRMHMTELAERGVFSNKTHDQEEVVLDTGRDMYIGYNIKADPCKRVRPVERTMRDIHRHSVRTRSNAECIGQTQGHSE